MHFNLLFFALAGLVSGYPLQRRDTPQQIYDYCQAPLPVSYSPVEDHQLLKVALFIRHGDRSPAYNLPGDTEVWNLCNGRFDATAYDNSTNLSLLKNQTIAIEERITEPTNKKSYMYNFHKGNCVNGQLTDKGKQQHKDLGESLRSIYVDKLHFLPEELDTDQLYVRSTDVWRTRQSAHSLLSGLYPNGSEAQSVPILTYPTEVENLSRNKHACPALSKYEKLAKKEPEWIKVWDEHKPLMDRLNKMLGTSDIPEWNERWGVLHDVLWTRICHGMPLPCSTTNSSDCVTMEDANVALEMAHFEYSWLKRDSTVHNDVDKADLGVLMSELKDELLVPTVPFSFYSAHDDTLATLMGMLKAEDYKWPPYASHFIIEVWQRTKKNPEKIVRVLFNGKVVVSADQKPCADLAACPLDTFTDFLASYIPDDVENFCEWKA